MNRPPSGQRERLAQRSTSGQRQTASQRARSAAPASPRAKQQAAAAQRARAGGPNSRRGTAGRPQKRSTALTVTIFGTVLVVLVVLVIVLVSVTGGKTKNSGGGTKGYQSAPASVVNAVTGVSTSAFAAAGSTPTSYGPFSQGLIFPKKQPALTMNGKPLVIYVGSNFCPYCAATRWPLTVALARFGTFKHLKITSSGPSPEVYPSTNTLSFYGSSYTSPYISFLPTEQCTDIPSSSTSTAVQECNGYLPLENLTGTSLKTFTKYDFPPFQTTANKGGIPFVDLGNKVVEDGAFIDPTVLAGYSHAQIAQSLINNPTAAPASTILVAANYYSAMICKLTNGKPGSVCKTAAVKQAATALKL